MSELRRDPILGRWVIISSERINRPSDFMNHRYFRSSGGFCPFCSGNEHTTPPEIMACRDAGSPPDSPGWTLRVVPNKFPALQIDGHPEHSGDDLFQEMDGIGAHEIIIETPEHDQTLASMPSGAVEAVFRTYKERIDDLSRDQRLNYALLFKNSGPTAGATLEHAHSQLIALPVVPGLVQAEMEGALSRYRKTGRCIYCEIMVQERERGRRIVLENEHFIALTPFASPFSFELWILPLRHSCFTDLSSSELTSLSSIFSDILGRINRLLGEPAYNFVIHTYPLRQKSMPHYHWHLEFIPKLTQVAGFECGSGFYINPTPPEEAAAFLRKAGPEQTA